MMTFRVLHPGPFRVAESPVWDDRRGQIFFVDIDAGAVHAVDLSGRQAGPWTFDAHVGCLALCDSGRLLVALTDRLVLLDPETGAVASFVTLPEVDPGMRSNDGKCGPDGAFWLGTTDTGKPKRSLGKLYRVTPDGAVSVLGRGFDTPNGLAWSPDGRTMWRSDSRARWIARGAFDPATGAMGRMQTLARPDPETGRPDGAAMDVEGRYWSAGVSAGFLNLWEGVAEPVRRVPVPAPAPTMPCFCGDGLGMLAVTSIARDVPGVLLLAEADTAGAPVARFDDSAMAVERP